jgi:hypothetical protein
MRPPLLLNPNVRTVIMLAGIVLLMMLILLYALPNHVAATDASTSSFMYSLDRCPLNQRNVSALNCKPCRDDPAGNWHGAMCQMCTRDDACA